jgi:SPP1 gp7 family putative phage head morphogenesis protein
VTPDLANLEARQDRDKREKEDDLLLLLLLLMQQARNRADMALAVGADPLQAVRDVFVGNTALRLRSPAPRLAQRLHDADVAGFRRTVRVVGDAAEAEAYAPTADYGSQARQALAKMLGTLQSRLAQAIREAAITGQPVRQVVRAAFEGGGYVESATSKAWLLESTATTLIGFAYSGGWFNGWARPHVATTLKGFRFSAVLDSRTTNVCRACNGVKLPTEHPWIQTHTPPLHFNCRSVLLPLFRDFEATEPVWTPWPMPGFGHAPAIVRGFRYVRDLRGVA